MSLTMLSIENKRIAFISKFGIDPTIMYLGDYEYEDLLTYFKHMPLREMSDKTYISIEHGIHYNGMYVLAANIASHIGFSVQV